MVVVTHEVQFARKAADRILFMEEGRIIEWGRPAGGIGWAIRRTNAPRSFLRMVTGEALTCICWHRLPRTAGIPPTWRVSGQAGFAGAAPFRAAAQTAERGGLDAVLPRPANCAAGGTRRGQGRWGFILIRCRFLAC